MKNFTPVQVRFVDLPGTLTAFYLVNPEGVKAPYFTQPFWKNINPQTPDTLVWYYPGTEH